MTLLTLAIVLALGVTYAVRRRYYPAPVAWSADDERAARAVAAQYGVSLEEARLAIIEWRSS